MDGHQPQNGAIGCAPWPYLCKQHSTKHIYIYMVGPPPQYQGFPSIYIYRRMLFVWSCFSIYIYIYIAPIYIYNHGPVWSKAHPQSLAAALPSSRWPRSPLAGQRRSNRPAKEKNKKKKQDAGGRANKNDGHWNQQKCPLDKKWNSPIDTHIWVSIFFGTPPWRVSFFSSDRLGCQSPVKSD